MLFVCSEFPDTELNVGDGELQLEPPIVALPVAVGGCKKRAEDDEAAALDVACASGRTG